MSLFPPYDRRSSSRRAAHPAVARGGADPAPDDAGHAPPPHAVDTAAAPATPAGRCANCDADRLGEYCADCGQHFVEDRLTVRVLAAELWERVTFERGMLRTLREMTTDPGGVVRRYTQGRRRRYASPFTYLFVGAALSLLLLQLYEDGMVAWMRELSQEMARGDHPVFTAAQHEAYARAGVQLARHTTYTSLGLGAVFACVLRLLFRKSGVNLVESFVFALYTFGHVYFLALPVTAVATLWLGNFALATYALLPLYVGVCALAAAQFFGRGWRSALRGAVALLLSYAAFSTLTGVALVMFALLSVREGITAPRAPAPQPPAATAPAR